MWLEAMTSRKSDCFSTAQNPKCLREFCEGVEAARQVVHPTKHPLLLKFIESKITREAKDRLLARTERNTWDQIKVILEENYAVKRTLEHYAGLFTSKQGNNESVDQWGSRIDSMGMDLIRETRARIEKVNPNATEGGVILVSELMKSSFVAGLKDDRIKYIVKARGEVDSLAQLIETALQEESEVKSQKFKGNQGSPIWPNPGYSGYLRKECRPQIKREVNTVTSVKCYRFQRIGHISKNCRVKVSSPTCETFQRVGHESKDCRARNSKGNRQ
jgi:hypothetical protein